MPKTLKERLDWLYKNDPIFRAEKDIVDMVQKEYTQKQKQKGDKNETSNTHNEVQERSRD
jgi:hypothetical protein